MEKSSVKSVCKKHTGAERNTLDSGITVVDCIFVFTKILAAGFGNQWSPAKKAVGDGTRQLTIDTIHCLFGILNW